MKYLFYFHIALFAWALPSPEELPAIRFPFKGRTLESQFPSAHRTRYEVALYDDVGVWDTGREHLKMYLKERGISYTTVNAADILEKKLKRVEARTLIMPGGESIKYLSSLGVDGGNIIRSFVEEGGGYIGICAGSFYATSYREGGAATGPYGIGLLSGTAYDGTALHTPPFIEGMMDFKMENGGILAGFSKWYRTVLFGGPSFRFSKEEAVKKNIEVLARVNQILEPTMLTLQFGDGQVFLSGPHLEIEEERTDWGPNFKDPDSEWPILDRVFELIRNKK